MNAVCQPQDPFLRREDLQIRAATEADLPAVLTIEEEAFSLPWTRAMFLSELSQPRLSIFLVGELRSRLVGYVAAWVVLDELHISNLAVHRDYRGQRLGQTLLGAILDAGIARGVILASLEVRPSNTAARQMYGKFGFLEVALRRGYYSDTGEDAIVMIRAGLPRTEP